MDLCGLESQNHEFGRGNSEAGKTESQMQPIYMVTNGDKVLLFP